ncbi:MAG: 5-formyltetrahydrofolate cyclo-ligase, partial [Acidimicrobiia bacterium]
LTVHPLESAREVHRFGYEHPVADAERLDPADLDIVLTPSLAFAHTGDRIGWGMGYYDGLFVAAGDVTAVGVTLERLLVDTLPVEPHDRRMNWLATDRAVYRPA